MAERLLALRRPDRCRACGSPLPIGTEAWWDSAARTVTCIACRARLLASRPPPPAVLPAPAAAPPEVPALDPPRPAPEPERELFRGIPGTGAKQEGQRRAAKREAEVRQRYGRLAGVYLRFSEEPQHIRSWTDGAIGERAVGRTLEEARPRGIEVLHDCSIPGSRANIDHIVVAPTGIWVVDAKRHADKKIERRDVGGWFSTDHRLYVGGRDRTNLVAGVRGQVERVTTALAPSALAGIPVHGVLCFVQVRTDLFASPMHIDGVVVTWRARLVAPMLGRRGRVPVLGPSDIGPVARHLAQAFPPR